MWIADSYAKINLGLNVLEIHPSGRINVETGLCFLDWRDRFEVEQADSMKININSNIEAETNTAPIEQAIKALERYIGLNNKYHFSIEKRIPAQAGLGSYAGSAALTLRMLNKIEDLQLTADDLINLSRNIDNNIPFFIRGEAGINHGINKKFEPIDIQPHSWIVTCYPEQTNRTTEGYPQLVNRQANLRLKNILTKDPVDEWQYVLTNNFEQTVFQHIPVAGNLKDQFYEFGAIYAAMAGRGTAVYGLFEQNFVAVDAYKTLINLGYQANLTKPQFTPDWGIYRKG